MLAARELYDAYSPKDGRARARGDAMMLSALLDLGEGERVAVVGCGGKTTLIDRLADENAARGVLIAPTTRIALNQRQERPGVAYLGQMQGDKLCAVPLDELYAASRSFALTLMEADGSKGLPLKGWAEHEPAVPGFATRTIAVVSVRAVGSLATEQNIHRLPLFLAQVGLCEGDAVDEPAVARMACWCMNRHEVGKRVILINQADDPPLRAVAWRIAEALKGFDGQILIGSMREGGVWSAS